MRRALMLMPKNIVAVPCDQEPQPVRTFQAFTLVHQVRDWYSGVAIKMGRRQGGPSRTGGRREHI